MPSLLVVPLIMYTKNNNQIDLFSTRLNLGKPTENVFEARWDNYSLY
jgi:hypothetical protein